MDLRLKGKNVVVTGGSKGIGKAIALAFANEGANVAICARNEVSLRKTEVELRPTGVKVYAATCDVADSTTLDAFLEEARQQLGSIDILVNNASGFGVGDAYADWEASLNIDLMASVRGSNKVIPWMAASGGGCILFVSSISGIEATGFSPAYSAAKAGLISYSKNLALALARQHIRVNTIAPGSIEFEGGAWERVKAGNRPFYDMVLGSIPSGRMGMAEEVASVAVFVASERANWVTGACIPVDGGQHKGNL